MHRAISDNLRGMGEYDPEPGYGTGNAEDAGAAAGGSVPIIGAGAGVVNAPGPRGGFNVEGISEPELAQAVAKVPGLRQRQSAAEAQVAMMWTALQKAEAVRVSTPFGTVAAGSLPAFIPHFMAARAQIEDAAAKVRESGRNLQASLTDLNSELRDRINAGEINREDLRPYGLAGGMGLLPVAMVAATIARIIWAATLAGAALVGAGVILNRLRSTEFLETARADGISKALGALRSLLEIKPELATPEVVQAVADAARVGATPSDSFGTSILKSGAGIALVIGALVLLLNFSGKRG